LLGYGPPRPRRDPASVESKILDVMDRLDRIKLAVRAGA
jgi:hypothetical protein